MKSVRLVDVASRAQVSIVTASRAMNGRESVRPYIRERVAAAAEELGYKPNLIARAMATKSLNVVSLSVFQLFNPFFGQMATDLSGYLKTAGYQSVFCDSTEELREFNASFFAVGSILLFPRAKHVNPLAKLRPVVTVGAHEYSVQKASDVSLDFSQAYTQLARVALKSGRRKMAAYTMPGTMNSKFPHVENVLKDAGLKPVILPDDVLLKPQKLADLLSNKPGFVDTIFCGNDLDAAHLIFELQRKDIRIPEDVQIVGCDGTVPLNGVWTVQVDVNSIASHAVRLLMKKLHGNNTKEQVVICPVARV